MKFDPKSDRGKYKLRKLTESAITVIGTKGFSEASVSEITRNAGVSYGLFYLYFKNKEDLLDELVKKYNHELRYYLKSKTGSIADRIEMEKEGFKAFFVWVHSNMSFFRILLEAQIHRPDIFRWHYTMLAKRYSIGLSKAMEEHSIKRTDPEVLAYTLMGISDFLARKYVQWDKHKIPPEVLKETYNLLERILRPDNL